MADDVRTDQFVIIKVDGLHCHKCEQAIRKNMQKLRGVHEVEVDFASGQASILYDRELVSIGELMEAIRQVGYIPAGFTNTETPLPSPGVESSSARS